MAKAEKPLLSLGASGTLGDVLTYGRRYRLTTVRKKPVPRQPNTLAQIYHRWDYQNYIDQWHALTPAQKRQWQSNAVPYHMSGFAYWMRLKLRDLPDLIARWHLDEASGANVFDSSRNSNTGTIFGANFQSGRIDGCRHFDGINDRITFSPIEMPLGIFAFINPVDVTAQRNVFALSNVAVSAYFALRVEASKLRLLWQSAANNYRRWETGAILTTDTWYLVGVTLSGPAATPVAWLGDTSQAMVSWGSMGSNAFPSPQVAAIGQLGAVGAQYWDGLIDEVILFNAVPPDSQIIRHSERRYP